jgi:dnd system-associated protein 4
MEKYRVKRPKEYVDLLQELRDSETGVFDSLKSALVFAAAVGFKNKIRIPVVSSAEQIPLNLFNENKDLPFIFALALSECKDANCLRDENFQDTVKVFEEYAHGGLSHLEGALDRSHMKESIERLLAETDSNAVDDLIKPLW